MNTPDDGSVLGNAWVNGVDSTQEESYKKEHLKYIPMATIKYSIDYQEATSSGSRPIDDGEVIGIRFDDNNGFALIPDVGDYVNIGADQSGQRAAFAGVVRSRSFFYQRTDEETIFCHINIVVEHSDVDTGLLIKE
jgi:hypothetical protein